MAKKENIAKQKPGPPTQRFLDIAEIKEDTVVLKDGTLRAVIMVSSINFALKSQEEQQATIQAYMQFLNGLEFPIQVVIQSRKMNIDSYMQALDQQEQTIDNELLKAQIQDYRSFINDLVDLGEIMQKRFYLVVPYDPVTDKRRNFWSKLGMVLAPAGVVKLKKKDFIDRKYQLMQRAELLRTALAGMSLESALLDTQGLIELYYSVYNPEVYDTQKIGDIGKLQIDRGF